MSHPLLELRRLLGESPKKETGVVTLLAGSVAKVTTQSGVKNVPSEGLALGDCVIVHLGVIQGKVANQRDLPVYHL